MDVHAATKHERTAPDRSTRRAILGLALGLAVSGVDVPAGLAAAEPVPKRWTKRPSKRQPKPVGGRNRTARRRRKPHPKPRYKVVTRTFLSTVPITIPDSGPASPYPSIIQVGGLRAGTIQDINVTLSGFSTTAPRPVSVVLVAPDGLRTVVLMNGAGGGHDISNVTLTFDDQAAGFLSYADPIMSGVYKPTLLTAAPSPDTAALRWFNGRNPNGTWRLYVLSVAGVPGSIAGWALTIRARVRM